MPEHQYRRGAHRNDFELNASLTSTTNPNSPPLPTDSVNPYTVAKMGRVRTKTVKKSAKVIIERYYPKLSLDFETNKRICDEVRYEIVTEMRTQANELDRSPSLPPSVSGTRSLVTPPT